MEPDHALPFGQAILYCGGAIALVSWGVGNLFSKMTSGYGGIISALQEQNLSQQKQLDADHVKIAGLEASHVKCLEKHEECDKQQAKQAVEISELKDNREADKRLMGEMKKEIEELKEKSHVTAAMQDVSVKVDQVIDQTKPR